MKLNDTPSAAYAKCIEHSKKIRWDIERDVIRGRQLLASDKFLPDSLSLVERLPFLQADARRLLSQVQGRSYANIFGLVERFIAAKMLEVSREHWLGDQVALEALIRFCDEEIKHQELFRRVEALAAACMPAGYRFLPDPDAIARVVLSKSTWAVLALTCHIEIFTQVHYKESIAGTDALSPLWQDVFRYHWLEESQHATLDELEWAREDAQLTPAQRDAAVDDLIALVAAVDGVLQAQAGEDANYFLAICPQPLSAQQGQAVQALVRQAYRYQYIVSGVQEARFQEALFGKLAPPQKQRVLDALESLLA